ncbi:cobalt ABC transporter permease [Magnetovibrio sp. PR-2]|uniref:cobalt ABC transporter permease n=1 Tax=Magnetovibrio sp. PR-2 TaxID=3120356 RepID=UPI002FCE425D
MHKFLAVAVVAVFLATSPASAHKVIMAVFESGDVIEGELGFSNGVMSVDQLIEVFDENQNKLGETKTDEDGFFTFKPTQSVAHIFQADLGAGHIATTSMSAEDVAAVTGIGQPETDAPAPTQMAAAAPIATGASVDKAALAKMIRDELRPLRREISAYKEKNDLQTILGGIGYIVGIFGMGMYVAARQKLKEASA